jgi:hypothetical protein
MAKIRKLRLDSKTKKSLLSWIANDRVDATANYAKNGRVHEKLPDEALCDAWVLTFNEMSNDHSDLETRGRHISFQCEMELRGIEPPFLRVAEASQRYVAAARVIFEKLMTEDPDSFDLAARRIAAGVKGYEDKTKNGGTCVLSGSPFQAAPISRTTTTW